MKRRWVHCILALLLCNCLELVRAQTGGTLVILHSNDIHGQILPRADGSGGMAALATLIRRVKPDLVLDAGDMFTGTVIADEYRGKPLIEIMNRLNYAAVALGNHEFDYGLDAFHQRAHEAHFPILSANVHGLQDVQPFTILNVRGVRIGVIGLTVENLTTLTHPKNTKTITVDRLTDALERVLPVVRPQSDFVILLAHLSLGEQTRVAKAFPEIQLIIAGHPHVAQTSHVGPTLIVQTSASTEYLGRIDIRLDGKTPANISEERIPVRDVPPDPEIESLIAPYRDSLAARSSALLGEATSDLRYSRVEESALPNLITDAIREFTGAPIAIHNIGGIRATLRKGPITYSDVFQVVPFENTVVRFSLSGAELRQALGRMVVAVSGLRVVWDETSSPLKVTSVRLEDGSPIRDQELYTIATNDFLWAGGDGLAEFKRGRNSEDTGALLRDVVADFIRHHPKVSPRLDGRVTIRR
jgi:2',3'-cyclic-nucleotide 2'-phosphodiesterase (5'-nucleotidase family)